VPSLRSAADRQISDRTVTLSIPPQSGLVRFVRLITVALARLNGIEDESIDDVRLATSEACNRAVGAHRSTSLDTPVTMQITGGRQLTVIVRDSQPLPPASGMQAADLLRQVASEARDVLAGGGGGTSLSSWFDDLFDDDSVLPEAIGLITGLADDVIVRTGPAGTSVTMVWNNAR